MQDIVHNILPIFLIAFIGSIIRRKWIKSDEFWRGLEKLSFYLLFPAVLFKQISSVEINQAEILRLVSALILATAIVSIILIYYQTKNKYDKIYFTSIFQGGIRYNNYILFGLSKALFGKDGLSIIATISPYMIIFTNILSIMIFVIYAPKERGISFKDNMVIMIKSVAINPFVLASLLGFAFNYFHLSLNVGVDKTIENLADSALVIGVLIVGASLRFKLDPEHINMVTFTSFIKLIIMPIVTYIILWSLSITGINKSAGILFSCMPCASSAYILSRQLGGDPETMSSIITFTTVLSVFSLSMLVYIL